MKMNAHCRQQVA